MKTNEVRVGPEKELSGQITGIAPAAVAADADARAQSSRPQFSVKARGVDGYVGSAWLNEGKFGKYISVRLRAPLAEGATLYLAPTKDNPEIL
jgi:uncharacterized protein (DUF736 family)